MLSWLNRDENFKKAPEIYKTVVQELKTVYELSILPVEKEFCYYDFHGPPVDEQEFDAKPMILLLGPYSSGKTNFIRYLLEQDFPVIRTGPESSNERFVIIMKGEQQNVIPGSALVVDPEKQFRPLCKFGDLFRIRLQCSVINSAVLEYVTLVDSPSILSGEQKHRPRGYDFPGVIEWFGQKADLIYIVFDASNLEISDEVRICIEALRGHDDKIRIILNKADMLDHQELMRVYGQLMCFLSRIFKSQEVPRVYFGSFNNQPLHFDYNKKLFEAEENDLLCDIQCLLRVALQRKLDDVVKRARLVKIHACIISELQADMPEFFRKKGKEEYLTEYLSHIYLEIQHEHDLSLDDFPAVKDMQEKLLSFDFIKFKHVVDQELIKNVTMMIDKNFLRFMKLIHGEEMVRACGRVQQNPCTSGLSSSSP